MPGRQPRTPSARSETAFRTALASAIRPGGGLVIDFSATAESVLPGFKGEANTLRTGDITVAVTAEYDIAGSRLISAYRFTRGAETLSAKAIHHVYTIAHLGQLLTDAGFTGLERYSGPDCAPFQLGDGRLLLTARRADHD